MYKLTCLQLDQILVWKCDLLGIKYAPDIAALLQVVKLAVQQIAGFYKGSSCFYCLQI